VGAWWLSGGHEPDHRTIGKLIEPHAEVLTEEFFVALVRHLAARLRLGPGVVASDGTVVEAAASCYRLLRGQSGTTGCRGGSRPKPRWNRATLS
jgi:hypothetical protein